MSTASVPRNVILCSATINACAKGSLWPLALKVLGSMPSSKVFLGPGVGVKERQGIHKSGKTSRNAKRMSKKKQPSSRKMWDSSGDIR